MEEKKKPVYEKKDRAGLIPHIANICFATLACAIGITDAWPSWVVAVIIFGVISSSVTFDSRGRMDARARQFFAITVWMNIALFTIFDHNLVLVLPCIAGASVMLSLLDSVRINWISIISTIIIYVINIFIFKNVYISTSTTGILVIMQLIAVIFLEILEYALLKRRIAQEEELIVTFEQLRKAEEAKDDFMANVSHEIRTPLNAICGMGSVLLEEKLPEKAHEEVFEINIAGRHLMSLVNDILDFTELEQDKFALVENQYNITSIINDVVNMAEAFNESRNLHIIVDCDGRIPNSLIGDGQKIYRILLNLVNNAVKFTNEGAVIIKACYRRESYGINLCFDIKDTGIGMSEQDLQRIGETYSQIDTRRNRAESGIGLGIAVAKKLVSKMDGFINFYSEPGKGTLVRVIIPQKVADYSPIAEVLDRKGKHCLLFDDPTRHSNGIIRDAIDEAIKNTALSLGVDIYDCNNISEYRRRMESGRYNYSMVTYPEYLTEKEYFDSVSDGCQMCVIATSRDDLSKIKNGIRIIIEPAHVFAIAALFNGTIAGETSSINTEKEEFFAPFAKILVVDDVLVNLRVVASLLKKYQIVIDTAESGRESIRKIQENTYDLVFMDHMMPEMDGVEALHRIRALPGNYAKTLPIVALTANAVGGAREMLIGEGFDDFVAKPIENSQMERVLKKYLAKHIVYRPEQGLISQAKAAFFDINYEESYKKIARILEVSKDPQVIDAATKALKCLETFDYVKAFECFDEIGGGVNA